MPGRTPPQAGLKLETPLGPDALVAVDLDGEEHLSAPFDYRVEAEAAEDGLDLAALPGQSADLILTDGDGGETILNAIIWSVRARGRAVTLRLRPWLALLELSSDRRVFQEKGVLDIVETIVTEASLGPVRRAVATEPPARAYCVQVGETHAAFVARLLEAEGVGYFFEHARGAHTLVLFDEAANCPEAPGGALPVLELPPGAAFAQDRRVEGLTHRAGLAPGKVVTRDYAFETPDETLEASIGDGARGLYLWPGGHATADAGQGVARRRLEAREAEAAGTEGQTPWRPLRAGQRITLTDTPDGALDGEHLVRAVRRRAGGGVYAARFDALPTDIPYRPPATTPVPVMHGPQTAVVTGPDGEEIWTDAHGRVRVQFHWDRHGNRDENASCWLRVAQIWAGAGWGAMALPRIGQEVVVSFLDGDPDRPLVTGVVYNGANPPPYDLPAEQTKTTLRSDSSKDAEGFNELRFEDKAGEEEVYLHAQKDMTVEVENARTTTVKAGDDSLAVETGSRSVSVDEGDHTLTVSQGDSTLEVTQGDRTVTVGGTMSVTVTGDETREIRGKMNHHIVGDTVLQVDGALTIMVGGNLTLQTSQGLNLRCNGAFSITAGGAFSISAGSTATINAGSAVQVNAGSVAEVKAPAMVALQGGVVKLN